MKIRLLNLSVWPVSQLTGFASLVVVLVFLIVGGVRGQGQRVPPRISIYGNPAIPASDIREQTLDQVWSTIAQYYYDPNFNEVDWPAVYKEFRPRVLAAKDDAEVHRLLGEMIGRLNVSHLAIIPPEVFTAIKEAKEAAKAKGEDLESWGGDDSETQDPAGPDEGPIDPFAEFGIGVDLRIMGGRLIVTAVDPGSSAYESGIKTGYELIAVNSVEMAEFIERVNNAPASDRIARMLPLLVVKEFLNGDEATSVMVTVADVDGKASDHVLDRRMNKGESVELGSGFPIGHLRFESRDLTPDIGYIRFTGFSLPVIDKFCTAITEHRDKQGLIIDLRGNLGGIMGVSVGVAGMLSDKPLDLGAAIYRFGREPLLSQPKANRFEGKVVILTDGLSVSAAEMFAAGLQESGRAVVIGELSAGETLPAITVTLPTGATLQYPIANYRSPKGRDLEGKGVVPSKLVRLERAKLLAGIDSQIEAGIAEITAQLAPPPPGKVAPLARAPVGRGQGSGYAMAPPPPPPKKPRSGGPAAKPPRKFEPAAVKLMEEFARAAGGPEPYEAIESYELKGTVDLFSMGAWNKFRYRQARSGGKWAEIFDGTAVGEIKEIRDGTTSHLRTDPGQDVKTPFPLPVRKTEFLTYIISSMKPGEYVKLLYLGEFEREGRKVQLVDAETKEGLTVAIYFDSETKMLAGYEGPWGGISFQDYRPTSGPVLPYRITSSLGSIDILLDEITVNEPVDPEVFVHRERCFDRVITAEK